MFSRSRSLLPLTLVCLSGMLLVTGPMASAQPYPNFALTNVSLNIGCAAADGSYSYYLLSLNAQADGLITGSGTRHDVAAGNGIAPASAEGTSVVALPTSKIEGPVTTWTKENTFTKKVSGRTLTLTNKLVSEGVHFAIFLNDGGTIKGVHVFNSDLTQTAKMVRGQIAYTWKTNHTFYSGQAFATYGEPGAVKMGSLLLGD